MKEMTYEQIVEGAEAVLRNAKSLIAESALLLEHGFHARAYCLAHLSREEFGKLSMLFSIGMRVLAGTPIDWKKFRRRFRDHKQKIINDRLSALVHIPASIAVDEGIAKDAAGWRQMVLTSATFPDYWNRRKNDSLYVSIDEGSISGSTWTCVRNSWRRVRSGAPRRAVRPGRWCLPRLAQPALAGEIAG